jgi:hypothetical protein
MNWKLVLALTTLQISIFSNLSGQIKDIYEYQENASSQIFWAYDTLAPNGKMDFLKINDQGVINRFWWTTFPKKNDQENLNLAQEILLNIYWDNSDKPAISVPIADFFCQPNQLGLVENHFFNSTNDQLVFNSMIPMPFRTNARFELVNYHDEQIVFFYGVDLELKELNKNTLYLHSYWQYFTDLPADSSFYVLPEIEGRGKYLGTHFGLHQKNVLKNWPWYTRPTSIFLDKTETSNEPNLFIYTLDDYLGSGWWDREQTHEVFNFEYTGRPVVSLDDEDNLTIVMYRYHVIDPLWFSQNMSFQVGKNFNWENQKIGNGHWATTAFFYLDKPISNLPEITNIKHRITDTQ